VPPCRTSLGTCEQGCTQSGLWLYGTRDRAVRPYSLDKNLYGEAVTMAVGCGRAAARRQWCLSTVSRV